MLLATIIGSINFFCDIASIISEISVELGWNRLDPASSGQSCIRVAMPRKVSDSDLIREIASATSLSSVVTCCTSLPTGLSIISAQSILPSARPARELVQVLVIHDSADELSPKRRTSGKGSEGSGLM